MDQTSAVSLTPQEAAAALLERRGARRDLTAWARLNGFEPALHHQLMISELEKVAAGAVKRLMILVPPGSAKSSYASVLFPPWYLANHPKNLILSCSYSHTLAERFGKRCRNIIETHGNILGYRLSKHSQAADDWETSLGGVYFCAGVGAGIAGHRADLAIIDDYLGSQEDADSKLIRDKQEDWFWNDFMPRLKPNAPLVIIANRRHEDDLVGRLLENDELGWRVIRLPMEAESDDPLGRPVGARLWPEWFTDEMVQVAKRVPRTWAGLYQQRPAPEEGDYFKKDWLLTYSRDEYEALLATEPRLYGAADWAVSEARGSNRTCFGCGALGSDGYLYVLPDLFWKCAGPKELVSAFVDLLRRRNPRIFWSEKGHISKSLGPFIKEQMLVQHAYCYIDEVTPARDKETRAQSIRGRMSMLRVKFPSFASWWSDAVHELLTFPGGKNDDFVDFIAHLGMGINNMVRHVPTLPDPEELLSRPFAPTMVWLKSQDKEEKLRKQRKYAGR